MNDFCEWNDNNIKSIKSKTVFIDEFSMVPNEFNNILYKLWLEYNFKIVMFGDPNQCNPVEGGSQIYYDYINSVSVRQMCPALETLKYIEKCGRYDLKTKIILDFFLEKVYISKLRKTEDGKGIITRKGIFNHITKS